MIVEEKGSPNETVRLKVEQQAYEVWKGEGCPHGCDGDHWLRAEAEITSSQCAAAGADVENQSTGTKGKKA